MTARDLALVLMVGAVVLFSNLGGVRLWDRDEPRNAGCAYEMLQRGDWVTPVFNAELRTHKPVLVYWLMMSAYAVFGVNEFAARFWSATCALGTMLATYWIGRRLFNRQAGLWAALVLGTNIMFDVAGRAATPDSVLILCGTLAILVYVLGVFPASYGSYGSSPVGQHFPAGASMVVAMYGMLGLGLLAKGPVGMILPMGVIGMYMLLVRLDSVAPTVNHSRGRLAVWTFNLFRPFAPVHFARTLGAMRPGAGTLIALAVALPWYVLVGVRTDGAWPKSFFLEHNVGRAWQAMEGHKGGPWFYPVALLIGFFPWSVLSLPVVIHTWRMMRASGENQRAVTFCLCWLGVYVGAFSLASTKLPSYITPAYPAAALLTGSCLDRWLRRPRLGRVATTWRWTSPAASALEGWMQWSWLVLGLTGVGITLGLFYVAKVVLPGAYGLVGIGLVPLVGATVGWQLTRMRRPRLAACNLLATAGLFCVLLFGFGAAEAGRYQQSDQLLSAMSDYSDDPQVAAFGQIEPSWVYYAKRPIQFIESDQWGRLKSFLTESDDRFAITTEYHLQNFGEPSDEQLQRLAEVPYFLKKNRLVLLSARRYR
jgi:4-amino-4-deoxy-L-arabinose transferase-like glycosyltransferase